MSINLFDLDAYDIVSYCDSLIERLALQDTQIVRGTLAFALESLLEELQSELEEEVEKETVDSYDAGHHDGYDSGYQEALDENSDKISELESEIKDLEERVLDLEEKNKKEDKEYIEQLTACIRADLTAELTEVN